MATTEACPTCHNAHSGECSTSALKARIAALSAASDAAVNSAAQHTIALEQQNIALLRWQSVASDAHVDHLCAIVRSLAVSDEPPRTLRDLSAMGVEEEIRRLVAAERVNREKSEASARQARKDAEDTEARALDAETERAAARQLATAKAADVDRLTALLGAETERALRMEGERDEARAQLAGLRAYLTRSIANDLGGMEEAGEILDNLSVQDRATVDAWALEMSEPAYWSKDVADLRAQLATLTAKADPRIGDLTARVRAGSGTPDDLRVLCDVAGRVALLEALVAERDEALAEAEAKIARLVRGAH